MFKRKQTVLLIAAVVVSMFALVGCGGIEPSSVYEDAESVQVEWVEINPPPGQDGPCYAFFSADIGGIGYVGFGFAGAICP